jgi:hypothetical protein
VLKTGQMAIEDGAHKNFSMSEIKALYTVYLDRKIVLNGAFFFGAKRPSTDYSEGLNYYLEGNDFLTPGNDLK